MSFAADSGAGVVASEQPVSVAATLRWTLPLAVMALGVLLAVTFRARPAPGFTGKGLVVTLSLTASVVALLSFERIPPANVRAKELMVLAMIGAAATLVAVQPDGPGFLFMYPPVAAASFRFPRPQAVAAAGVAIGASALAAALGTSRPLDGVLLDELALAFYFILSIFAGRFIRADEQSQFLIAQLEETRTAQAEAAVLAERQRLAREMHDVLAHSLSGLLITLEATSAMAESGAPVEQLEESLGRASGLARTGLDESRRAINMLRDDDPPGPERIERLCQDFEADAAVPCRFELVGEERPLAREIHLALYRVAQESLTNARKHASPDRVEVSLSYEPGRTRLVVEDFRDAGQRPAPGGGTGFGLTGMRERAALLGGTLQTHATDRGFRVELCAPDAERGVGPAPLTQAGPLDL
jgi:signal transduction histidine kinase